MEELIKDKKQQEYDRETRAMLNDIHTNYQFIRLDREIERLERLEKESKEDDDLMFKMIVVFTIIGLIFVFLVIAIITSNNNDRKRVVQDCKSKGLNTVEKRDKYGEEYYVCSEVAR